MEQLYNVTDAFTMVHPLTLTKGKNANVWDDKDRCYIDFVGGIINLATRATSGLFEAAQIKADAHINAVGAYQASMKEVSNSVIEASTSVIIDDAEGGLHEAGDLIQAHEDADSTWTWNKLTGTLSDLVNEKVQIDLNADKGITLFKSVGAASFDAAVALKVAQKAKKEDLGQFVEL